MSIFKKKLLIIFTFLALFTFIFPLSSFASENFVSKDNVFLQKDETVNSDYYAAGGSVFIDGTVVGDAYVAGGNVVVNGLINGDLLTAGGNISINGRVTGNVRAVGGQVVVNGQVDRNVTVAGGSVSLQQPAIVNGSITVVGGNLLIASPIGKGAVLAGGQVNINNVIGGDVRVSAEQLTVLQNAKINGGLTYWSPNQAHIVQFTVKNGVTFHKTELKENNYQKPSREKIAAAAAGIGVFWIIVSFCASFLVGLILLHFVPVFMKDIKDTITTSLLKSMGVGFITILLFPFAIVVLLITLIGIPFAALLGVAFVLVALLNQIFIAYALGKKLLPTGNALSLFAGLVVYSVVSWIPVIGWMFNALALFVGMGALVQVKKKLYDSLRTKKLI